MQSTNNRPGGGRSSFNRTRSSSGGFQLGQSGGVKKRYGAQIGQTVAQTTGVATSRPPVSGGGYNRPYTPRPAGSTGYRPYTPNSVGNSYSGGSSGFSKPGGYNSSRPNTGGDYRGGGDRKDYPRRDFGPNRNNWIRAPQVMLINDEGENIGIVDIEKALIMAHDADLDLVEVSKNASPPVCKIIDYSKYLYEQKKKAKQTKQAGSKEMKELKFSPVIDEHDIKFRIDRAVEFISKGHNVRLTVEKRGRQTESQVKAVMTRLLTYFEGYSTIEPEPKTEGKKTYITIKSDGKAKNKKNIGQEGKSN